MILAGAACSGDAGPAAPGGPASISFATGTYSVSLNGAQALEPAVRDDRGTLLTAPAGLTWESENPTVVMVDNLGVVRGVALGGPVRVHVRIGGAEASVQVTVMPAEVRIAPAVSAIVVGTSVQLALLAFDALGSAIPNESLVWSSDAPGVVEVDTVTGLATARASGETILRATTARFSATAGVFAGTPQPFDGEFVTTDPGTPIVSLRVYLGRVTAFSADYRPTEECIFVFGAIPNAAVSASGDFTFPMSSWATSVAGNLTSNDVINGRVNPMNGIVLTPACANYYYAGNTTATSVPGFFFTLRRQ